MAVRVLATSLRHKSVDPPVAVIDAGGNFAVSLLSGHWGGGNSLTRWLAKLIGAKPVVTTASDALGTPALDNILAARGLKIIDWDILPRAQGAILEGQKLALVAPDGFRLSEDIFESLQTPENRRGKITVQIDYFAREKAPDILRVAIPLVFAGIGFRKDCPDLREDFLEAARLARLPVEALAALSTVDEKSEDESLQSLAEELNIPLLSWSSDALARVKTPNPSKRCGDRFARRPFSVAEGAALLGAGRGDPSRARLLVEKKAINGRLTAAFAVPL